jgi:hypothetical protein
MKPGRFTVTNFASWVIAATFTLSLASQFLCHGQAPPGAGPPPVINPRAEDRQRQLAEGTLRSAEMDAATESENKKRVEAAIINMKEDFTRIQVIRNDIARNLVAGRPLEYTLIADQTAEIHKRASRLNIYMLAHAPENKGENNTSDPKKEEMVGALVKLCKLIDSFTDNPALKNAGMLDVKGVEKAKEDKARADKDLIEIIKLSESVHKKSQELKGSN